MAVSVFAPASVGNLGVGFDLLGAALKPIDGTLLGDVVTVDASSNGEFSLAVTGRFAGKLPDDPKQNILYDCYLGVQKALAENGIELGAVAMTLEKNLPIGSGLGSSAASIVAAVAALNEYAGSPLSEEQALLLMGDLEGQISGSIHFDNVAPSYLGGIQLMAEQPGAVALSIPAPQSWYWVSAYPGITVSTSEARKILPENYPRSTLIDYGRYLSTFIHALHTEQHKLAASVIHDVVAEPYRKQLLPGFREARAALEEMGALAVGISGSGPTLFALCDNLELAQKMNHYLQQHYLQNDDGFSHICQVAEAGTELLETE